MPIATYIRNLHNGGLAQDVKNYLLTEHDPNEFPFVVLFYRKENAQEFFYEGTVRAQIAHFLQEKLPTYENEADDWIVVSEQPYSKALKDGRADILLRNLVYGYTIVIEVKSDLNLSSAQDDAAKLLAAMGDENAPINEAYVFFVVRRGGNLNDWVAKVESAGGGKVTAIGFDLPVIGEENDAEQFDSDVINI